MNASILKLSERIKSKTDVKRLCAFYFKGFSTTSSSLKKRRLSVNDEEFTDHLNEKLKELRRNPKLLLEAWSNFKGDCKMFVDEKREELFFKSKLCQLQDFRGVIEMVFTFERPDDLDKFVVYSDKTQNVGESEASLKITQHGTALFSGYINSNVKKDEFRRAKGYAGFITESMIKSFGREKRFDWSYCTHMVLKVRGDGRTYLLTLTTPGDYKELQYAGFTYPLYTRGGPYWQVTRIPFTDFIFGNNSAIQDTQRPVPLKHIKKFGISVTDEGPFKLEVDYVGIEIDPDYLIISPYEEYYIH